MKIDKLKYSINRVNDRLKRLELTTELTGGQKKQLLKCREELYYLFWFYKNGGTIFGNKPSFTDGRIVTDGAK